MRLKRRATCDESRFSVAADRSITRCDGKDIFENAACHNFFRAGGVRATGNLRQSSIATMMPTDFGQLLQALVRI
jgi:hypothetical protein